MKNILLIVLVSLISGFSAQASCTLEVTHDLPLQRKDPQLELSKLIIESVKRKGYEISSFDAAYTLVIEKYFADPFLLRSQISSRTNPSEVLDERFAQLIYTGNDETQQKINDLLNENPGSLDDQYERKLKLVQLYDRLREIRIKAVYEGLVSLLANIPECGNSGKPFVSNDR